eukprot:TRINITY_DN7468_c0_g1_i1.p1 TRINITY_DN7468_c0_g1~~TRINITY_DN7468_c0_g1_i1.p1  ORF type:complete len:236 (-),score=20.51 TRINITY_DN7468_c0_g1_i1:107-814(-)
MSIESILRDTEDAHKRAEFRILEAQKRLEETISVVESMEKETEEAKLTSTALETELASKDMEKEIRLSDMQEKQNRLKSIMEENCQIKNQLVASKKDFCIQQDSFCDRVHSINKDLEQKMDFVRNHDLSEFPREGASKIIQESSENLVVPIEDRCLEEARAKGEASLNAARNAAEDARTKAQAHIKLCDELELRYGQLQGEAHQLEAILRGRSCAQCGGPLVLEDEHTVAPASTS